MQPLKKLPSISRVEPGAQAALECPVNATYNAIHFRASGTGLTPAHFKKIQVRIDGKPVHDYRDLTRLIDLNTYWSRGVDDETEFTIHFYRMEFDSFQYRRMPGLGTADVQTLDVLIDIDDAAPGDIKLEAWADIDVQAPLGVFIKIKEFPYSSAVAGQVDIDKIPKGPRIVAAHFFKADISHVEMMLDDYKAVDAPKSILERRQKRAVPRARVPLTAKATHVDFCTDGDLSQSLVTGPVKDFRFKPTLDTAGAVDIVVEYLDSFEGA